MGRRKKKKIDGGFVPIEHKLINSKIWKELPGNALKILIIARRRAFKKPDGFPLSYSAFKGQMSYPTFFKMREKLVKLGLIEKVEEGGLFRNPNIYKLSDKWKTKNLKVGLKEEKRIIYEPWGGIVGDEK